MTLDVETFAATTSSFNVWIVKHEAAAQLFLDKVHFCAYDMHQSLSVDEYLYTWTEDQQHSQTQQLEMLAKLLMGPQLKRIQSCQFVG